MRLSAGLLDEVVLACRIAYPNEACGLLAGPRDDPDPVYVYQLDNVAEQPRYRYAMNEASQLAVWKAIDDVGHRVHAIWHSHTMDGAEPSPEDLRNALDPDVWHLIVSLPRPDEQPQIRLWKVVDGCGIEQTYTVVD